MENDLKRRIGIITTNNNIYSAMIEPNDFNTTQVTSLRDIIEKPNITHACDKGSSQVKSGITDIHISNFLKYNMETKKISKHDRVNIEKANIILVYEIQGEHKQQKVHLGTHQKVISKTGHVEIGDWRINGEFSMTYKQGGKNNFGNAFPVMVRNPTIEHLLCDERQKILKLEKEGRIIPNFHLGVENRLFSSRTRLSSKALQTILGEKEAAQILPTKEHQTMFGQKEYGRVLIVNPNLIVEHYLQEVKDNL